MVDGGEARLYLNGTEVASGALPGPLGAETNPLILGGNGNGSSKAVSELVPGRLDEIMLYRRALGASEIMRLKDGALFPGTKPNPDGGP